MIRLMIYDCGEVDSYAELVRNRLDKRFYSCFFDRSYITKMTDNKMKIHLCDGNIIRLVFGNSDYIGDIVASIL